MIDVDEREMEVVCKAILESRLSAKFGSATCVGRLSEALSDSGLTQPLWGHVIDWVIRS